MTWASLAGMDVPDHRLVSGESLHGLPDGQIEKEEIAYAVRRFDRHRERDAYIRRISRRSSISSPLRKTEALKNWSAKCYSMSAQRSDFQEYIRRLVFCVVSGNTDEHLKNWSLRYPDTRSARLSPAYDLAAVTSYSQFRSSKLTLSIAGQNDTRLITLSHFQEFAESLDADIDETTAVVRDTIQRLKEHGRKSLMILRRQSLSKSMLRTG